MIVLEPQAVQNAEFLASCPQLLQNIYLLVFKHKVREHVLETVGVSSLLQDGLLSVRSFVLLGG